VIDDMTVLREGWGEAESPSPGAQDRARAALLARVAQAGATPAPAPAKIRARGWRLPGWAWRTGIATMSAAALVVGLVVVDGLGEGADRPPAAQSPAAETFELAAAYAEAQPFTPPRPNQWIYLEQRIINPGKVAQSKGQTTDTTTRSWRRADGRQIADIVDGKLVVSGDSPDPTGLPPTDYPTVAGLPTEPRALLAWLRSRMGPFNTDTEEARNATLFSVIGAILNQNVLPPAVAAAVLRAAALIPDVTQSPETVTIDGRAVTTVGRVQDGWRQQDILLDPNTREFLGIREVAVNDYTFTVHEGATGGDGAPGAPRAGRSDGGDSADGETVQIKKGEIQVLLTRLAGKIVDAPGQTG
jgi:hypothetical protein